MNTSYRGRWQTVLLVLSASTLLFACNPTESDDENDESAEKTVITTASGYEIPENAIFLSEHPSIGTDFTQAINEALFEAPANTVIVLPEGTFTVDATITIAAADGLTITGWGQEETKLDFSSSSADDSIKFEGGTNITIRDLGVYESPKNAIKVVGANGVHFDEVATVWESPLDDGIEATTNGAYGIYPLQSQNVLIENSYAKGSADAGIYVGQSNNIVVRNNLAEGNVAGIEIENSTNADVYNNTATGNTGGILIFDLPGLDQAYGGNIRIFNNRATSNNLENFGGGTVGIVPPGTGFLVFAASDVEIYDNEASNNETAAIEIASYFLADDDVANYVTGPDTGTYVGTIADGWSPLVKNIYIHDNTFTNNGDDARGDLITDMVNGWGSQYNSTGTAQRFPSILYGGIGELLSNAGALSGWDAIVTQSAKDAGVDHNAYASGDFICVNNNIDNNDAEKTLNIGQVYETDPSPEAGNFDVNSDPVAKLLIEPMPSSNLMNCVAPSRLSPATVTINGHTFGCEGDDLNSAACSL